MHHHAPFSEMHMKLTPILLLAGECLSHSLCASFGLAPPLLARFDNGLLYKFIEGQVTSPADMRRPDVSLAIARRLAEWHARIPVSAVFEGSKDEHASFTPDAQSPNLWTVLSRWISGLPSETDAQSAKKATLAGELPWLHKHLSDIRGIGPDPSGLVFSHCDLLSGNVIVLPTQSNGGHSSDASPASTMSSEASSLADAHASGETSVSFIDYEYATPAPAAFDIANHFAEWGGFDCDFSVIPNVQQRRDFITSYVDSYHHFRSAESESDVRTSTARPSEDVETLMAEVDRFRGAPGFYWGIWALIQAQISQISFDYASYAEVRLGEYWAWKRTVTEQGAELHRTNEEQQAEQIREKRWLQEA